MGVRLKRLKMVSTYIWVDTIASSDGVRKVCCPDGYALLTYSVPWNAQRAMDASGAVLYAAGLIEFKIEGQISVSVTYDRTSLMIATKWLAVSVKKP
ncbi:MAG: hypothetical protein WBZ57_02625 [Pseudomonas graminis]